VQLLPGCVYSEFKDAAWCTRTLLGTSIDEDAGLHADVAASFAAAAADVAVLDNYPAALDVLFGHAAPDCLTFTVQNVAILVANRARGDGTRRIVGYMIDEMTKVIIDFARRVDGTNERLVGTYVHAVA